MRLCSLVPLCLWMCVGWTLPPEAAPSQTKVCGRDYAAELVQTEPWAGPENCPVPLPIAMANGSRPAPNRGRFHVNGCAVKWFSAAEACALVGSIGRLVFDGDSLIRQLLVATTAILTGNLRVGGINPRSPPKYFQHCECERQVWAPPRASLESLKTKGGTPAGAPAAAADRTQRPNATCEGQNG